MNQDQFNGIARIVITAAATIAATLGWIDQNTAVAIGSALIPVVMALWSHYAHK